ncbi:GNAT family N-acetyltransferase [Uruburuella testudinis]|uniref:GNAT family N-acetyltransferase n=1 Tax=Uruburuella testudinis TaxID=1282863 RepID=A0ABY4DT95_9NEIS|nr:GNAT family N-acetyltransferase [Uruburuella testudinis]UOO82265.1 GNAT family N-acetyltransferase [Uruburuella testudinis]
MLVCNPYEIVIHGTTSKGKTFRPSDWAERLCGILSSFDKGNRLSYHEWVRPMLVDKVRCVAVDKKLEEINPPMFRFLMDFAADNDLRVMDCKALLDERSEQQAQADAEPERVLLARAIEEKQAAERAEDTQASVPSVLREIETGETAVAFAALSVLRPMLTDVNRFVEQVNSLQRSEGYRLLGVFEEGKTNAVAVCGFREETNLVSGRHIHIDDVVTIPQSRGKGYAARLLAQVRRIAEDAGIQQIHIDSNVGSERAQAHRLYFENGFEISAHHFVLKVE